MAALLKWGLTYVGAFSSERSVHRLNGAMNYVNGGRWLRSRGFDTGPRLRSREEVFDALARCVGNRQVLYLEFGVFQGASITYWSELLRHPQAILHGFDSFEGLPASWTGESRGHFSTGGAVPEIADPRVTFFPGWFEDTVPQYEPPPHEQLVLNIDSDLYSSAALVLRSLEHLIVPGSFLYFDEFSDRVHELQAFTEFLDRTGMRFRVAGAVRELTNVAFERIA